MRAISGGGFGGSFLHRPARRPAWIGAGSGDPIDVAAERLKVRQKVAQALETPPSPFTVAPPPDDVFDAVVCLAHAHTLEVGNVLIVMSPELMMEFQMTAALRHPGWRIGEPVDSLVTPYGRARLTAKPDAAASAAERRTVTYTGPEGRRSGTASPAGR